MHILSIALKEIKSTLREKRTFVFMLAFPVVLMLILGTALSNAFVSSTPVDNIRLLYKNDATNGQLSQSWQAFADALAKEGIETTPLAADMDGKLEVREDHYTAYAEIDDRGLALYTSSKNTIESNIVQGMLTAFSDRYNLAAAAYETDPSKAEAILAGANAEGTEFVRETALDADKKPGSIDYYAIAMTTMIGLYAALPGSMLFQGERSRNTLARLTAAPVSKAEVFIGKVAGTTFINSIMVGAVMLVSGVLFQADWGSHPALVLLVLTAEVAFSISFGLGLSYLFGGEAARTFIMIFTQVASFVGGAYFPIADTDKGLGLLTELSPLRWANRALTRIIFSDDLNAAWPTIGLFAASAAAFLAVSVISIRRKEAL
ncbi:ABC transporter permease [Cohnella suwonensis]|uniref:ABC transporter permease n=1 Tax=Cohnella suwonensis TaxID=696072 RepID=A0ABW0LN94_9BACL